MQTITAYTYRADTYCPDCIVGQVCRSLGIEGHGLSYIPEEALDLLARMDYDPRIDRMDESTFDSDTFPKVGGGGINPDDGRPYTCGKCGTELI